MRPDRVPAGLCLLLLMIFSGGPAVASSGTLHVAVSILPEKFFVERIGGDFVEVTVMIGPGRSPATWEPQPRQLSALAGADLYFRIGVPMETALMPKLRQQFPALPVVDLRTGIPLRRMEQAAEIFGLPDTKPGHAHAGGDDPHTWLSPAVARRQAAAICETLSGRVPDHAAVFRDNLAALNRDLTALETELGAILGRIRTKKILVFHPSWGYFADQFGFRQIPVEIEGKEPNPRQLARIIAYARREGIRVVFVQSQFNAAAADAVAQSIGGAVVSIDPLAENYCENLRSVAHTLAEHLR